MCIRVCNVMYGKCDVDMIERKIWQKTKITNETQYSWAHLDNIKHSIFQFENRFHVNRCVCAPHLRNENVWKIPNKGRQKTLRFHIIIFTLPTHTRTNAHTQRIMCVINIFVLHRAPHFLFEMHECVLQWYAWVCVHDDMWQLATNIFMLRSGIFTRDTFFVVLPCLYIYAFVPRINVKNSNRRKIWKSQRERVSGRNHLLYMVHR